LQQWSLAVWLRSRSFGALKYVPSHASAVHAVVHDLAPAVEHRLQQLLVSRGPVEVYHAQEDRHELAGFPVAHVG